MKILAGLMFFAGLIVGVYLATPEPPKPLWTQIKEAGYVCTYYSPGRIFHMDNCGQYTHGLDQRFVMTGARSDIVQSAPPVQFSKGDR